VKEIGTDHKATTPAARDTNIEGIKLCMWAATGIYNSSMPMIPALRE
jgi:hypothetical protein